MMSPTTGKRSQSVPPMVEILRAFYAWVEDGNCIIASDRNADGIPKLIPMKFNRLQLHLFETMLSQAYQNQPIRIIGLKGRKGGFSTFVQALGYFIVKTRPHMHARVLAHTDQSTQDIFDIARCIYVNDPSYIDQKPPDPTNRAIEFKHPHNSSLKMRTFSGRYALSSATVQVLHISELAKAEGDPDTVRNIMLSLLNAVGLSPMTIVIIESTANRADQSGEFKKRFRDAEKGIGSFVPVFIPWFWESTYRIVGAKPKPWPDPKDQEEEDRVRAEHRLDDEQLAWRQKQIINHGGLLSFQQEYPCTVREAFQSASGLIFPSLNEKTHNLSIEPERLLKDGYRLYRGFDWGGVDPFVCTWVAYKPGKPKFSIDMARCPNLWREMSEWMYDPKTGRPVTHDDHGIDCVRYVATQWNMTGHVHVFKELYDFNFAAEGRWIADNAHAVLKGTGNWPISASVGDKSRVDCLAAFRAQGVPVMGYDLDKRVRGDKGEVEYGIDRLNQLIVASYPIVYDPDPLPQMELEDRTNRRRGMFGFGFCSMEHMRAVYERREQQRFRRRAG